MAKSKEERLAQQRLCKRRRYAEIKADPELLILEKEKRRAAYLKRKENKKVTSIADKTPRLQREQRKKWKENSKKYRLRKKEHEKEQCLLETVHIEAEPVDPTNDNKTLIDDHDPLRNDCRAVKAVLRKYRYRTQKRFIQLKRVIADLKKKNDSQRKYIQFLKIKLQAVNKGAQEVKNDDELKPNPVISKTSRVSQARKSKIDAIINFYNDDKISRIGAGKKEYITRNKRRMQKRYLTSHLTDLYKQFISETSVQISYSFFCKCRPFWVLYPKPRDRDTCQCVLHSNMELLIQALNKAKILTEKNSVEVLSTLCCNIRNTRCLQRICEMCSNKCLEYMEFDNDLEVTFFVWKKVQKAIDSINIKKKIVTVTEKQKTTMKPKDALVKLETDLITFFNHNYKIVHQYEAIAKLKDNLNISEALVHVDFSENYSLKFAEEVQSMHFGASRQQVSIHTAVIYTHHFSTGSVTPTAFCTISKCLRHDVPAIWAHLDPLIKKVKILNPFIDTIHFLSDSPSSQYRNKSMFYVISQLECDHDLTRITWNYSEAGHGKGAPDGVGATLKRTADRKVNFGSDVGSFEQFYELIGNIENVTVKKVEEEDILRKEKLIPPNLKPFKGTFSVYQVLWDKFVPRTVFRSLSCFLCDVNETCMHGKHLGSINNRSVSEKENNDPGTAILTRQVNPKVIILSDVNVTYLNTPSTSTNWPKIRY